MTRVKQSLNQVQIPFAGVILIVLHTLLGLGALGGGMMLIFDPSGEKMGMPVSLLERTFFSSFLIPGLILLILFGVVPLYAAYMIWRRPQQSIADVINPFQAELHSVYALSLYVGFGQLIWIMVQTYMMDSVHGVHLIYMTWGMVILVVTLLPSVRNYLLK